MAVARPWLRARYHPLLQTQGLCWATALAVWYLERLRLTNARWFDSDDWEGRGGWNEIGRYSWVQKRFFACQERWGMTHCQALTFASKPGEVGPGEGDRQDNLYYYLMARILIPMPDAMREAGWENGSLVMTQ